MRIEQAITSGGTDDRVVDARTNLFLTVTTSDDLTTEAVSYFFFGSNSRRYIASKTRSETMKCPVFLYQVL